MPPWRDASRWRVLDTDFQDGVAFLGHWADWAAGPPRAGLLHYVAITSQAPRPDCLWRALRHVPALAAHGEALRAPWRELTPGFHRLELDGGRVLLTLCVGPLQAMLREQRFVADAVWLPATTDAPDAARWDVWAVKALARLCHRGTRLRAARIVPATAEWLRQAGFVWQGEPAADTPAEARFDPHWEPGATRHPWRDTPQRPGRCAVVGAGLAGASVAASLARRGWQVTVLDAAAAPAQGASGLPVGLVAPQLSRDDSARSRLSRAGVHLTVQWCRRLLREGEDWAPAGVRQFLTERQPPGSLWHAGGAWIKPARLVQACLQHPAVHFVGDASVQQVHWDGQLWQLRAGTGQLLAQAPQLVLATAGATLNLLHGTTHAGGAAPLALRRLAAWQPLGGQVSWGWQTDTDAALFPDVPVNGHGSFVSGVPLDGGARAWFCGATYDTDPQHPRSAAEGHRANWERLARLAPDAAQALRPRFDAGAVQAWCQTRHASPDRLPAIGPAQALATPSLWVCAGMGSRGLTYAALGAEWLAARLEGEPWPVEHRLARLLDAGRPGLSDHL